MANNPDLQQKTYYLHKELDKDLIEFISNCRNSSELIRNLLIRELRIQNGEISVIDIKNRQFIENLNIKTEQPLISNEELGKTKLKIKNQVLDSKESELIEVKEDITVGEYFKSIQENLKKGKIAYKITTEYQYDGMANFIFFYKFGKLYLHHNSDRDDFELDDIKDMPVLCVRYKEMKPEEYYFDDKIDHREINKNITLTFSELQTILNFIEETNDTLEFESKVLSKIYNKLMKEYCKCESLNIFSSSIELSLQVDLNTQQYISLYLYLKKQIERIRSSRNSNIYWDNIKITKMLENINDKIENTVGRKTIGEYSMWTIKD